MDDAATGLAPELGGALRQHAPDRSGYEPELGGQLRQNAAYVDESTCIGCGHCAYVARNTFFLEENYGRARVIRQDGDSDDLIQEAMDTCPVDCIAWVNYTQLQILETARQEQVIQNIGIVGDGSIQVRRQRARAGNRRSQAQASSSRSDAAAAAPD